MEITEPKVVKEILITIPFMGNTLGYVYNGLYPPFGQKNKAKYRSAALEPVQNWIDSVKASGRQGDFEVVSIEKFNQMYDDYRFNFIGPKMQCGFIGTILG